jgi:hypothetical protein
MKTPLIKIEDIIWYLSSVRTRPGMFFHPTDSYDVATTFAWGFISAAYFNLDDKHISSYIQKWYLKKMNINPCSSVLENVIKNNNTELTEKELIQKFYEILIEYFTEQNRGQ